MTTYAWMSFAGSDGALGAMVVKVPEGCDSVIGVLGTIEDFKATGEDWALEELGRLISPEELTKRGYIIHEVGLR